MLVRLRDGRYDAAGLRPTVAEWPPHPARLFCALVASAQVEADWAALRWLETAGAPEVWASPNAPAARRRGYVVTNVTDPTGGNQVWPGRTNGVRTRTACLPADPEFAVVWPDAAPAPATVAALVRLARRVPYLGRTTSPAVVVVGTEPTAPRPSWSRFAPGRPGGSGQTELRVPIAGYTARLQAAYAEGQRSWEVAPAVMAYVDVTSTGQQVSAVTVRSATPAWELLVFGLAAGTVRPPGSWLLALTATLRQAVISRIGTDVPAEVSGHGANGRHHLGYLALTDVGHQNARGHVLGVALAVPPDLPEPGYARLWDAVIEDPLTELTVRRDMPLTVDYDPFRGSPWGLTAQRWTAAPAGARRWVTATPVMLDRFPGRKGGDRAVVDELFASFVRAGLPEPCAVEFSPAGFVAGAVHRPRAETVPRGRPVRPMVHARITFDTPVTGPVFAGSMRYLGLGLFIPEPQAVTS